MEASEHSDVYVNRCYMGRSIFVHLPIIICLQILFWSQLACLLIAPFVWYEFDQILSVVKIIGGVLVILGLVIGAIYVAENHIESSSSRKRSRNAATIERLARVAAGLEEPTTWEMIVQWTKTWKENLCPSITIKKGSN